MVDIFIFLRRVKIKRCALLLWVSLQMADDVATVASGG